MPRKSPKSEAAPQGQPAVSATPASRDEQTLGHALDAAQVMPAEQSVDIAKQPCTKEAWQYLTSKVEDGSRPPLRFFVRRSNLVKAAQAVMRQLTLDEVKILVSEDRSQDPDGLVICGDPEHKSPRRFMAVKALVFKTKEGDEDEGEFKPIAGLPDEIAQLVSRHQDGSPREWGSVVLAPAKDGSGRQTGWQSIPLCGSRFFITHDEKTGGEGEVTNQRTHLGSYLRMSREEGGHGLSYSIAGAVKTAEIRQEIYASKKAEREQATADRKEKFGFGRSRWSGDRRNVVGRRPRH